MLPASILPHAGDAETDVRAAVGRPVTDPPRRAAGAAVVAPGAAAYHTVLTVVRTFRVFAVLVAVGVGDVPVGAPLPQVAVDVVQPQGVRLVFPHWAGAAQRGSRL